MLLALIMSAVLGSFAWGLEEHTAYKPWPSPGASSCNCSSGASQRCRAACGAQNNGKAVVSLRVSYASSACLFFPSQNEHLKAAFAAALSTLCGDCGGATFTFLPMDRRSDEDADVRGTPEYDLQHGSETDGEDVRGISPDPSFAGPLMCSQKTCSTDPHYGAPASMVLLFQLSGAPRGLLYRIRALIFTAPFRLSFLTAAQGYSDLACLALCVNLPSYFVAHRFSRCCCCCCVSRASPSIERGPPCGILFFYGYFAPALPLTPTPPSPHLPTPPRPHQLPYALPP
jgi:hypothetical protein